MSSRPLRFVAVLVLVLLAPIALSAAQTTTPIPDAPPPVTATNLPPIVNALIVPRRVVYLDTASSAGAQVMLDAYKSEDPEGQPLTYAHDVNGDGVFTPWFFRSEASEMVTMAGPFVATARVRDPLGAVGEQQIHMQARQFSRSAIRYTGNRSMPAFALVHGRPAFVYEDGDGNLVMTINDLVDGSGPWTTHMVKPFDVVRDWTGIDEVNWGASCQMAAPDAGAHLICTFEPERGGYTMRYLLSDDPMSTKWRDVEVATVSGVPAPTLGGVGGLPAVLYFNNNSLALLVATWGNTPDAVMASEAFELMWSTDVGTAPPATHSAVVPVGESLTLPAFAYLAANKAQLIYAVNQQADGRGRWDLVPIETQTGDIGTPSVAMVAGRPAIAYRDGAKGYLKLASSETPDGRGKWTVVVVDPAPADGPRTQSLAAIDGRASIAYEHATRGLLFAYDNGVRDAGYWPTAVVDHRTAPGNTAYRRSPTLVAIDGRPAIGYGPFGINYATAR